MTPVRARYLDLLVFIAGLTTLGVEVAASRLLDPWFGNSVIVWASLISLILLYLSVGYTLGGRLADRRPDLRLLCELAAWAGFLIGCVPLIARPVLALAARALGGVEYNVSLLGGSLLGVLALFAAPIVLLGCVTPFAVRLAISDLAASGRAAGRIYALSTVGSVIGCFLPVLVLIPRLGTRLTFSALGIALVSVALIGIWSRTGWSRRLLLYAVLWGAALAIAWIARAAPIKPMPGLVFEAETLYNYVQVVQEGSETWLLLNEGQGLHSVYDPTAALSEGIWDYFLVVPFFNPSPYPPAAVESLCLIGLAGGTVARLYTQAFGPIPIDGVELDPAIIAVGRAYFAMTEPNLRAIAQDGRAFLRRSGRRYDVIAVDAYRPPYIPFHLATVEFFQLARAHLTADGVIAVNVGRTPADYRLVDAIAATLAQVMPTVYVIDEPGPPYGLANSLVIGTAQPTQVENLARNAAHVTQPLLAEMLRRAIPHARVAHPSPTTPIFTDDRAPVEEVVHAIIAEYLAR